MKNNLEFTAIETAYRKFEFRSRLEAKYAVFFDLCGWSWSYEPPEFNGWIPDFAIGQRPTLVEVKPFYKAAEWGAQKVKIVESGCRQPVILLGADPTWISVEAPNDDRGCVWSETTEPGPIIGWLFDPSDPQYPMTYQLHFGFTEDNNKLGLCPMDGPWTNFIWSIPEEGTDKKARVWLRRDVETEFVERWAKACNASKWIPYDGQHRS